MGSAEVIVIDTSAIMALALEEAEEESFTNLMLASERLLVPASCILETSLVLRRRFGHGERLDGFLASFQPEIATVDGTVANIARGADFRYGRGGGHPARLNFGDCLSYAVAKHLDAPLLYKGDDFLHTDIESALPA